MAAYFEQTVTIDGAVYYPIESVPVETAKDARGFDTDVTAQLANGTPVILRDPDTKAILTQPLKSSPQNGFVQTVLASEPMYYYFSAIGQVFVVSPAYRKLQQDIDTLLASNVALAADATAARIAAANAQTAAQTSAAAAQAAAAAGGGGGGNSGLFEIGYTGSAWEYTSLAAAKAAGAKDSDRFLFLGAPREVAPPSFIRDGDIVGVSGAAPTP